MPVEKSSPVAQFNADATAAMQALIAQMGIGVPPAELAAKAFEYADAMYAERTARVTAFAPPKPAKK